VTLDYGLAFGHVDRGIKGVGMPDCCRIICHSRLDKLGMGNRLLEID
jgi:hypothetical protein